MFMIKKLILAGLFLGTIDANAAQIAAGSGITDQTQINNPQVQGHIAAIIDNGPGSAAPVISGTACTGANASRSLSDVAGTLTASGSGTCVVTFSKAFSNPPSCVVSGETATTQLPYAAVSATALTITSAAAGTVDFVCFGH